MEQGRRTHLADALAFQAGRRIHGVRHAQNRAWRWASSGAVKGRCGRRVCVEAVLALAPDVLDVFQHGGASSAVSGPAVRVRGAGVRSPPHPGRPVVWRDYDQL